ncbi:MAG: peptidase domain-containing ABC transporter [Adhaeribacter sp.]
MADSRMKKQKTPMQRFMSLLASERREIVYLYIYAVAAGLISLTLPLGIQSIIGFVSSGQIPVSIVVLIGLIMLALLFVGGLQVMQLWLVEYLQQRIFAKTAFDFAHRIPRFQTEALNKYYPPELMNRFFDVISLQKGLANILLDFSTAVIQILFGLILLSLYHPYFIFLGIILVTVLVFIIWSTGKKGVETSIMESKYKYKLVAWLEELARSMSTFKFVGHTDLPTSRTDSYVSSYLKVRKEHFGVLMTQYLSFVGFKTFITGGLLVLGCILVVQREINIGQFVASEIIIILIMSAVEKIIVKLDTVYDVLTSLDKLGQVTDLPVEEIKGIKLEDMPLRGGLGIQVQHLRYRYPGATKAALENIDFTIKPSERICLAGYNNSGKSTLVSLLLGLYSAYEGSIVYNGISLRDLHIGHLRSLIGDNISKEQVFDGTLLENLTLGRELPLQDVLWATSLVGLSQFVHELPEGLQSYLVGGSQRLPNGIARKIVMARSLVQHPKFLVIDDFWVGMSKKEKMNLMRILTGQQFEWTMVIVSNDPDVMKLCNRTLLLQEGKLVASGSFAEISQHELLRELIEIPA